MKYVFYFLLILTFNSCMKVDCDRLAKSMRKDNFLIVVHDMPNTGSYRFNISGINPITGEKIKCKSSNGWSEYNHLISIGDTIIKRKGELIFNIHKKDTVLSIPWECQGKIYK
jgi:hypothetical protein